MTNLGSRRARPKGVQFAPPSLVECTICTRQAVEANDKQPRFLRQKEVQPRGVQRKYIVQHMATIHGMQVVPTGARPVLMEAPPAESIWARILRALRGR